MNNKLQEPSKQYVENLVQKIFKEAENGEIKIGNESAGMWKFYVQFFNNSSAINNGGLAVVVRDKEAFLSKIRNYLIAAREFYAQDKKYFELKGNEFDEKLVMDLFVNATNFDLNNVEKYIEQRTKLLLDKTTECREFFLGEYLDCNIIARVVKNKSNLESPYRFNIVFSNTYEKFVLPSVYFGRIDKTLFIYALQGEKKKQENKLAKKLDRHFRKVNKGIDSQDEIMSQVSSNALISFVVFMAFQKSKEIENLIAYNFMPIRYESNLKAGLMKSKDEDTRSEFFEKHDKNQFNISNRFFNTIIRYAHHFNFPVEFDDLTETLNLNLTENGKSLGDNIVHTIDEIVDQRFEDEKINFV